VAGGVTERFHDMSVPQLRALNRLFSAMNAGVICSTISLPAEIEDFSGAELAMHFEPKKVVVQHWAFQGKVPAGWCWEA
jgi:hypothetical protein